MSLNIQTGSIQTTRILTSIAGDLPPLKPWQRENNKKEERDIWFSSGGKKLNIFDTREIDHQPSDEN